MDAIIWQSLLLKKIETHLIYEAPSYVTGHLSSLKNPVQMILSQFVKQNKQFFTSEKIYSFDCDVFLYNQTSVHGCV